MLINFDILLSEYFNFKIYEIYYFVEGLGGYT